jgi:hypothetical protein
LFISVSEGIKTMASSTPAPPTKELAQMPAGRWFFTTLGLIALLILVHIAIAWRMDLFGIFRDAHGRALITSEHERKAKYLLNQAYVPANFDSLIVGASASVNWRSNELTGYRFYNESLEGGDASEERKLVDQALIRGHYKVALVVLYPRVTSLHLLQDGFDQVTRTEVLGSINALGLEYDAVMNRVHPRPQNYFPDGSHELPKHAPPGATDGGSQIDPTQDTEAVEDYRFAVQSLADRGTRIVYVVCPLYQPNYLVNQKIMAAYLKKATSIMPPGPVIDFNAPEYTSFRSDPGNYIDFIHLSSTGAEKISRILNTRMHEALQDQ